MTEPMNDNIAVEDSSGCVFADLKVAPPSTDVGFIRPLGDGWPICMRCGKPVDEVSVDTTTENLQDGYGRTYTKIAKVTVTVKCHGEMLSSTIARGWDLA